VARKDRAASVGRSGLRSGAGPGLGVAVWLSIGLIVLTTAVFLQVKHFEFVALDDPLYVSENPHIADGISTSSVAWAFTTSRAANWHPLTWLSHMADVQLFGLNAGAHHVTSAVLHLANTLLLFWLLFRLTGAAGRSAFVAAMFAVHPLHVESVAWISERKDVLSTLFWLLALWAYVAYVRKPGWGARVAVAVFFVLGLMAKPMVVTLPFTLLLLDVWPLERWKSRSDGWPLVREKLPLFGLAAAASAITFMVQQASGAVSSLANVSVADRISNAVYSYAAYLWHMFWPRGLAGFYPLGVDMPATQLLGALVVLAAVSTVAVRLARRAPYFFAGWWWYVVTLLPVIGLVQVGAQAMADRYTYVPMIGIAAIVAWGATDLFRRYAGARVWLAAVATAVVALMAVTAHAQAQYWRNSTVFWTRAATKALAVKDFQAHLRLGRVLTTQGRTAEAIDHYAKAVELQPDSVDAQLLRGSAALELNRADVAATSFEAAAKLQPDRADAHQGLGLAQLALGDATSAVRSLDAAARLEPSSAVILNDLGWALLKARRPDEARSRLGESIRLKPDFAGAHANLALTYAVEGKLPEALPHFREALRLDPGLESARINLGRALAGLGRRDEAIRELEEALRRNPGSAAARELLEQIVKSRQE
jgi:Flp pilus assembly protein TadD